jgi:hypothetical protein
MDQARIQRSGLTVPIAARALLRRQPQGGVTGDGEEIRVGVEDLSVVSNRDCGDEAVGQLARGFSVGAACAVELRGLLKVVGALYREQGEPVEQAPQLVTVVVVAGAGEHLHHHHVGARKLHILLERSSQPQVDGAAGGAQELHPR